MIVLHCSVAAIPSFDVNCEPECITACLTTDIGSDLRPSVDNTNGIIIWYMILRCFHILYTDMQSYISDKLCLFKSFFCFWSFCLQYFRTVIVLYLFLLYGFCFLVLVIILSLFLLFFSCSLLFRNLVQVFIVPADTVLRIFL